MATPKPKVFRAAREFSHSGSHFKKGDPVDGIALQTALRYGERFVVAATRRNDVPDESTPQPAKSAEPKE